MRRYVFFVSLCMLIGSTIQAEPRKILLQSGSQELLKELQSVTSEARIVPVDEENVMDEIEDADAFIGRITPEQVRAGKQLKWVQTMSAGVETVLHLSGGTDLRNSDIILTNNQIVQGPEIADHAMAMLLTLTREIDHFLELKKSRSWERQPYTGIELHEKTALVVGLGGIGTQIAFRAWGHGMRVIGVDTEDIPYMPVVEMVVKPDQLGVVLPEADVIFVAAPHTSDSHKMFGPAEFNAMKEGAYFIAVSRGRLYDLESLTRAVENGRLAGAGVDVTDPEPLPEDHKLWSLDNVIITPHIAGRSDKDRERMVGTIKANILRFVEGKPLINVVDKQKGY